MKTKSGCRVKGEGCSKIGFTIACIFFTIVYTLYPIPCLYSATYINGFYETELSVYRDSNFEWNMNTPKHYAQMKFWSNPVGSVDMYGQFSASTNEDWNERFYFQLDRAWGKYWHPKHEFMLLAKEERHWVSSPLLNLVDTGRAVNNGLACRYDLKDFYGFNATAVASQDEPSNHTTGIAGSDSAEWYGKCFDQDTEVYITKLNRRVFNYPEKLTSFDIGTGYNLRKRYLDVYSIDKDTNGVITGFTNIDNTVLKNEIISLDLRIIFMGVSLTSEFARSNSSGTASVDENRGNAVSTELRDLHFGPFRLQGKYFNYGENFRSELSSKFGSGSGEFGKKGYYSEFTFLVPEKLINLTYKRTDDKTHFDYSYNNQELRSDYRTVFSTNIYRTVWNYAEIYVEFLNGLKGKTGYDMTENRYGNFSGVFLEAAAEDSFAYGRVQVRLKDRNSESGYGERLIYAGELRFNLTDRLQAYSRAVSVQSNHLNKDWYSAFYQIRYNIGWSLESYLEYGDSWATDNMAFDGDITDTERDITDVIKLIMKLNF